LGDPKGSTRAAVRTLRAAICIEMEHPYKTGPHDDTRLNIKYPDGWSTYAGRGRHQRTRTFKDWIFGRDDGSIRGVYDRDAQTFEGPLTSWERDDADVAQIYKDDGLW